MWPSTPMSSLAGGSLTRELNDTVGAMLISMLSLRAVRCILIFCPFQVRSSVLCAQDTLSCTPHLLTFIRLQGVTTCQTITYFRGSKSDSIVIRSLVILIHLTYSPDC